ncbi:MAG: hypothetical protein ABFS56_05210 [Pseudomonadota bacterium]
MALAYAYLIVPHRKAMTKDTQKRIDAIGALEELGMEMGEEPPWFNEE